MNLHRGITIIITDMNPVRFSTNLHITLYLQPIDTDVPFPYSDRSEITSIL